MNRVLQGNFDSFWIHRTYVKMRYTFADAFGKRKFAGRGEIPTVHGVDAGDRKVQL